MSIEVIIGAILIGIAFVPGLCRLIYHACLWMYNDITGHRIDAKWMERRNG